MDKVFGITLKLLGGILGATAPATSNISDFTLLILSGVTVAFVGSYLYHLRTYKKGLTSKEVCEATSSGIQTRLDDIHALVNKLVENKDA